ncbi:ST3 beta-galactoside alpha-2,3-sialyltransferase 7 [Polypterus senegalus]|nr:ST3 beta-galactoside alpha-2,3-sialyltransferase 7 [Polypterus senegalus]XP_039630782.1 ST3 beta-galactoside alpha-2,3-sialyltransferase 7 [Polypterus senegalus]XP_039630792.1 ST3 beta-galactoside alpha-2,3-sialyltransferase 7 [Polypterus senegalus]XP_039630802.1 ST3 beta-galactoside alpha-2,3-sialyltransferase 7 [Polypterus senegalus]
MEAVEQKDFFIHRRYNLTWAFVLLIGCYLALLYPVYFPRQKIIWRKYMKEHQHNEVLLNHSAELLNQPCHLMWSQARLRELYSGKLAPGVPVFLQMGDVGSTKSGLDKFRTPFGLKGNTKLAIKALQGLPHTSLTPELVSRTCKRCVVVGSGGVLHGSRLGSHIDRHNIIIRLNDAPVTDFEEDVGSRTTIRLTYPEGAPKSPKEYSNNTLLVIAIYKSVDLAWISSMVNKQTLGWWTKLWFWKSVVESVPIKAENFRILNPKIILETAQELLQYPEPHNTMTAFSQVPTIGMTAVIAAIRLCDEVSLAGFGYSLEQPDMPLRYYDTLRMDAMKVQPIHDVETEKIFLRTLVHARVINDLSGGIS